MKLHDRFLLPSINVIQNSENQDFEEDKQTLDLYQWKLKDWAFHVSFLNIMLDVDNYSLKLDKPSDAREASFFKIEVIDSGCGITEQDIPHLFQKFSQVGFSTHNRLGSRLKLWLNKGFRKWNESLQYI